MMKIKSVIHKFSTARAEFHSKSISVEGRFVVPPFIDAIDLSQIDHSMAIVGGRGCGKTTYVRYFSHWTQFDKAKSNIDREALNCLVLYWKPDTNYFRSMSQNWLSPQHARMFFHSLSGLLLLEELIAAIDNVTFHFPKLKVELQKNNEFWERLEKISDGENFSGDLLKVDTWIADKLYDIQVSINSNDISNLVKIDPNAMFSLLLPSLVSCETLSSTRFKVFVDEFENLAEYQQMIINGYRKHSDAFLSWNVAHKRYARLSNATDGDEKLQKPNDYREYILDEEFGSEAEEKFFLCELLLLSLVSSGLNTSIEHMSPKILGDRTKISLRKDLKYRESVNNQTKRILPTMSNKGLAEIALSMSSVRTLVTQSLNKIDGVTNKHIQLLLEKNPEVAIASMAIVTQRSFKGEDLISYIDSNFSTDHPYYQRVLTYLFTSLLSLNARYTYITIPLYSGFDRFCQLSTMNIRHFFELCYNSFLSLDVNSEVDSIESFPSIELDMMHKGAISASTEIIEEIPTYTPMGLTLSGLVNRLGDIFQIWQKGEVQSEPEKTHFFILHDFGSLPKDINEIIEQAKCWRVLIEYPATKDKNSNSSSGFEYRMNPIYAPYFNISFRKIRRIEFSEDEFKKICFSDNSVYERLRRTHIDKAKIETTVSKSVDEQGTLF